MKRMAMIVLTLTIFIIPLVNCSAQEQREIAYTIEPLRTGETLYYERIYDEEQEMVKITIYREKEKERTEVKSIEKIKGWPKLISNGKKMVYLSGDGQQEEYYKQIMYKAYLVDGNEGIAYQIGNWGNLYDISEDGRFVSYAKAKYYQELTEEEKKNKRYVSAIPVIMWKDIETGQTREYDFSDSFLKDEWGTGTPIRYIPERQVFSFNFSIEYESFSKGYISKTGGEYQEYNDVLNTGHINDDNVHIRKAPSLDGKLLTYLNNRTFFLDSGDDVDIIDKTDEKMRIGNMNSPWYKVRTFLMYEGWVYGAYVDIDE